MNITRQVTNNITYFTRESEDRALKTHYGTSLMGFILKLLGRNAGYVKSRASELNLDLGIYYELEVEDYAKIKNIKPMGTSLAPYKACLPELRTSLLYDAIWKVQSDSKRDKLLEDIREDLYGESGYVGEATPVKVIEDVKEIEVNYREKEVMMKKYLKDSMHEHGSQVREEMLSLINQGTIPLKDFHKAIFSKFPTFAVSQSMRVLKSIKPHYKIESIKGVKYIYSSDIVQPILEVKKASTCKKPTLEDIMTEIASQLSHGEVLAGILQRSVCDKIACSQSRYYSALNSFGSLIVKRNTKSKSVNVILISMPSVELDTFDTSKDNLETPKTLNEEVKPMIKDCNVIDKHIENEILEQLKQGEMPSGVLRRNVTRKLDVSDPRYYSSMRNLGSLVTERFHGVKRYRSLTSDVQPNIVEPVIFKIEEVVEPTIIENVVISEGVSEPMIDQLPTNPPSSVTHVNYIVYQNGFQIFSGEVYDIIKGYVTCLKDFNHHGISISKEEVTKTITTLVEF